MSKFDIEPVFVHALAPPVEYGTVKTEDIDNDIDPKIVGLSNLCIYLQKFFVILRHILISVRNR